MPVKVKKPSDKGMIRVLVYGTLKEGHSNHSLLEAADAIFVGYDSITGSYDLFDLGAIPAVMDKVGSKSQNIIRGELWAVNPEGLAALDLLEGHPHLYRRRKIWTDVNERRAWIYMLNATNWLPSDAEPITLGLWHASSEEKKFWLKRKKAA